MRLRTAELSVTVKERELLLQEVHHRVKNNLQVISSLMNMQMRQVTAPAARAALAECKTRVEAIALIHEKLYQSADFARVPFSEYATTLAGNIFHATGASPTGVTLDVQIDDVSLPVDQAIPCGLILNELITNAVKHAFPGERSGKIIVELRMINSRQMLLAVGDDGVGMTEVAAPRASRALGMQLVETLAAQLDGQLEIIRGHGTQFRITFPIAEGPS